MDWVGHISPICHWPILDSGNQVKLTYYSEPTNTLKYYVMVDGRALLVHPPLLRLTSAGCSVATLDLLQILHKLMFTSQPSTHQLPLLTIYSKGTGRLPSDQSSLSVEERVVVRHFQTNHSHSREGRFVVPLPKNPKSGAVGESRTQAVRRFLSLERSLNLKNCFQEFNSVMQEYLELRHAETVPTVDLEKSPEFTFHLPMHAVYKATSTTTRIVTSLLHMDSSCTLQRYLVL